MHSVMVPAIAGALAVGAASESQAVPAPDHAAAFEAAASGTVTHVRWRRWGGWWGPRIVIGGVAPGAPVAPYYYPYAPYGPYWGYPGYWGSRSSVCWDRGRRIPCPGSLP